MEAWRGSKYGKLFRFCDHGTLTRVGEVWNFYSASNEERQSELKKSAEVAIQRRNARRGELGQVTLTGLRSAAPASVAALGEISDLHEYFWEHGSMEMDTEILSKALYANPMLFSTNTAASLHYGTDPMLGFHLAAAYSPLVQESPSNRQSTHTKLQSIVAGARHEFCTWSNSFRRRTSGKLTLRFFTGDALAFCHSLQHRRVTGAVSSAGWYRTPYVMEPLVLDEEEFGPEGSAPASFTVIDTSNLIDHIGALNLLVAASPLLAGDVSASLYTEILVRRGESHQELVDNLLCGHLPTVSLLIGLFPVDYWTNA